jgi:hypothetical protein
MIAPTSVCVVHTAVRVMDREQQPVRRAIERVAEAAVHARSERSQRPRPRRQPQAGRGRRRADVGRTVDRDHRRRDEFRDAEKRVAQRLKELEPAVAEYRELEAVAQRLGIDVAAAQPTRSARPRRRTAPAASGKANGGTSPRRGRRSTASTKRNGSTPPAPGRRPTQPGKREERLLALIRERPGITVAEAGNAMRVDPTGLYRVVARLEQRGAVQKAGRELKPVS